MPRPGGAAGLPARLLRRDPSLHRLLRLPARRGVAPDHAPEPPDTRRAPGLRDRGGAALRAGVRGSFLVETVGYRPLPRKEVPLPLLPFSVEVQRISLSRLHPVGEISRPFQSLPLHLLAGEG